MVKVSVKDLWMSFDKVVALKGINLDIKDGEFITFLGPSGCGKTTFLRIIAGLYRPTRGEVFFDEKRVTDMPPWERNVGLVFQDYALWPHLTVYENIIYGLKLRKIRKEEIDKRVKHISSILRIEDLLNRYPYQLSGGQQQRVALARAIIINPSVLLLDEPLSNLDAKVRVSVRTEIRKLQRNLRITLIYVTHDQEEALVLSDRIAVMNMGVVEQVGTPIELYYNSKNMFVADFMGQINILTGRVKLADYEKKAIYISTEIGEFPVALTGEFKENDDVYVVFRPENVEISKSISSENGSIIFKGVVDEIQFLGNLARLNIMVDNTLIKVEIHNPVNKNIFSVGDQVYLKVDTQHIRLLGK
ncbi:MAG: ABC transporter ATP-binding protein [Nitrososphaeria archaeon]